MGRSCSLWNSGWLFLRRSLRKTSRVRMIAVMTKADTRPARRGSGVGARCSTVAGTQTHPRDHLTSRSLKPDSFVLVNIRISASQPGQSATGVKYKPQQRAERTSSSGRASTPGSGLVCADVAREDYFVNLALFSTLWLKVTTTERRRLHVCAKPGPIKPRPGRI